MVQEVPDIKVVEGQKSISEKYHMFVTCSVLLAVTGDRILA